MTNSRKDLHIVARRKISQQNNSSFPQRIMTPLGFILISVLACLILLASLTGCKRETTVRTLTQEEIDELMEESYEEEEEAHVAIPLSLEEKIVENMPANMKNVLGISLWLEASNSYFWANQHHSGNKYGIVESKGQRIAYIIHLAEESNAISQCHMAMLLFYDSRKTDRVAVPRDDPRTYDKKETYIAPGYQWVGHIPMTFRKIEKGMDGIYYVLMPAEPLLKNQNYVFLEREIMTSPWVPVVYSNY